MNLYVLSEIAKLFNEYEKISYIGRLDDNLIKLVLDNDIFYIDLAKSKSDIFCSADSILAVKKYSAPFDFALQKYCLKSEIEKCEIDGNNRILRLFLSKALQYKKLKCILQLEFTGKYTNAIILDSKFVVLESLRKITQNSRIVKVGIPLTPLEQQQNFNIKEIEIGESMIEFLHKNYITKITSKLESSKQDEIQLLENKKQKLQTLLSNLPNKDDLLKRADKYAEIGKMLQNSSEIELQDSTIKLKKYDNSIQILDIDFVPKSRHSLINEFFTHNKKLKAKAKNISLQEENLKDNINFLDSKISFIKNATNLNDIKIINPKNQKKIDKKESKKYESFFINDLKISVGKNQKENIELLKDARANDIWMHIRGIPSSHLIIHCSKNIIREEILQKAALILCSFLKTKSGNFIVDYTKRKFIRIKEGANVVYSNYSTINIKT